MAVDKQKLLPIGGMNLDSDEQFVPETQATFIKNHINAVNNLEDGSSGGQSTNALTPYPSISTNFDEAYFPHLRTYTVDLSGALVANSHIISYVRDTTETDSSTVITNIGQLSAFMVGLGWTSLGAGLYSIINTTYIWQKFIYRIDANSYYSSAVCVKDPTAGVINGLNTCIGSYYDLKLNQMLWFNYNDANRHNIQLYDATQDTYTTVLETPLLNFDLSYRISSIDLVQAIVQVDGSANPLERLLYWTDKTNPPRKINIDRAIGNEYWNHSNYLNYRTDDEFICAVKYPPQTRITGSVTPDSSTQQDYIDSNSYQFAQNFVCDDGEQTKHGIISSLVIARTNDGAIIFNNQYIPLLNIDAGSSIVSRINLFFRIGNNGDWRQFYTINRSDWLSNTNIATNIYLYTPLTFNYIFKNENAFTILDQATAGRLYDKLPIKAGSQEFLDNNILAYADILTDYDNLSDDDIALCDIDITYNTTSEQVNGFMATQSTDGVVYSALNPYVADPVPFDDDSTLPNYNNGGNYDNTATNYKYTAPLNGSYSFRTSFNWAYLVADTYIYRIRVKLKRFDASNVLINTQEKHGLGHSVGTTGTFFDQFDFTTHMDATDYVQVFADIEKIAGIVSGSYQWQLLAGTRFQTLSSSDKALKGGGVYNFGFIMYDEANRSSYVQTSESLNKYINTPMENGAFMTQSIVFNFNGLVFPDWVKKVAICRTQNTVINRTLEKGFIQYVVSSVEYTDDSGNAFLGTFPSTATTKVKIQIEGVDQFSTQNYNQTSLNYQFAQGDQITIMTASQSFINPTTYGIITKEIRSTDGIELIFDMDDRLLQMYNNGDGLFQLTDLVQIWTPNKLNPTINIYYEITEQLEVDQSTHTYVPDAVTLDTWDTYFLERVDYPLDPPYANPANVYTFIAESHSFSDTLETSQGEDIGRINVVNENAGQLWYPSLVRYSMPYVQDTFINGLSTFDSGREKTYFRQYGNITRMYCEQFNLCLIQEEKAFRVLVNRNLLTTSTGDSSVTLTTDILSDALEIQGNFGCQNGETFIGRQGQLFWWDLKRGAFVGGTFERVEDISALYDKEGNAQGIQTYALKQSKSIFNINQSGTVKFLIHAGFDPKLNQVIFTNFGIGLYPTSYVNNNDNWAVNTNDTVAFKTSGYWASFLSFTPEMYSMVEGHRLGNSLVSFKQGTPYFHNLNNETTYLNFYGTTCDKYFEICANKGDGVKNPLNVALDSKNKSVTLLGTKYSAVSIVTSNNQASTIPLPSFVQREGFWFSNFYRNTNLGGTIITGDVLKYNWMKIKFKGDTTKNSEYNSVRGVTVLFNDSKYTV